MTTRSQKEGFISTRSSRGFGNKNYSEVSSLSDTDSESENIVKKDSQFVKNSSDEEAKDPPDFSSFALKRESGPHKNVTLNRGRLLKRGSTSSAPDSGVSTASKSLDDCTANTKVQNFESKCVYKANREALRRKCAPTNLQEDDQDSYDYRSSQMKAHNTIYSKPKRKLLSRVCNTQASCNNSIKFQVLADDPLPVPISNDDPSKDICYPIYSVDAFGLLTDGLRGDVVKRAGQIERILAVKGRNTDSPLYTIKETGKCYRKVVIIKEALLQQKCPQLLRNFWKRMDDLQRIDGNPGERENSPAFNPLYIKVHRIIAWERKGSKDLYLVKWCGLQYSEATWESKDDIAADQCAIERYQWVNSMGSKAAPVMNELEFKDGRKLREYQEKGLAWMDHNYQSRINCILADEMGLGKTMQAVSMLQNLRVKKKIRGPFLVIAPVSTLGHWSREIESLTDMNCVVFCGSAEDRAIIKEHEFFYPKSCQTKFHVLLTSFEIMMKDQTFLCKQEWRYIVVDEAHRLKSINSKTTRALKQLTVRKGGLLLLTGTPVQNNTKEIFSLLNVLDPEKFGVEEEFLSKYGDIQNAEQVKDLQENVLKPRLLRRMKEDVEKSIPQKEETIIWVELTKEQRFYYKAILESKIVDLLKGSQASNIPNLRNVAMELRKLCNHPFLCNGLQEDLSTKFKSNEDRHAALLCEASGKMMLLDKLLPMLKNAGHRVLIFSQFAIMLDLLEEYLIFKDYSYERIDGTIRGSERQAAIDRYSSKESDTFIFLLSTRAGGLGITLTAADTCIIYDSDWNPQNDLQAMARCHRIGQTKDVRIYRLITRNTYEQHLFECSSRKYGLDEAILGGIQGVNDDNDHAKNVERLLKKGAYGILQEDGDAAAADFHAENIEQILVTRTEKRLIGGHGNNSFSVATFISTVEHEATVDEEKHDLDEESTQFWQSLLPEACAVLQSSKQQNDVPCGARRRLKVNYREKHVASDADSSDGDYEKHRDESHGRKKPVQVQDADKQWSEKDVRRLEGRLIQLGTDREEQVMIEAALESHGIDEVRQLCKVLVELCHHFHMKNAMAVTAKQIGTMGTDNHLTSFDAGNLLEKVELPYVENLMGNTTIADTALVKTDGNARSVQRLIIPPFAQKAVNSPALLSRLQRNATRYLQILQQRKELAKAVSDGKYPLPYFSRNKRLPKWWGESEDMDLMLGSHKHGHHDFHKIREDMTLRFASILQTLESRTMQDEGTEIKNDDLWPSDAVLSSRLKKLIQSFSSNRSEAACLKNEAKAASKNKVLEQRGDHMFSKIDEHSHSGLRVEAPTKLGKDLPRLPKEPLLKKTPAKAVSKPKKVKTGCSNNEPSKNSANSHGLFRPLEVKSIRHEGQTQQRPIFQEVVDVPNSSSESEDGGFQRTTAGKRPLNSIHLPKSCAACSPDKQRFPLIMDGPPIVEMDVMNLRVSKQYSVQSIAKTNVASEHKQTQEFIGAWHCVSPSPLTKAFRPPGKENRPHYTTKQKAKDIDGLKRKDPEMANNTGKKLKLESGNQRTLLTFLAPQQNHVSTVSPSRV